MKVTTTEFRKDIFQLIERALNGELVEVSHKGRTIRLVPEPSPSKLSRLRNMNVLVGTPDELDEALNKRSSEAQANWEKKWHQQ
jgi:antitoxin (DNA-binding transcriptional repressor) of toxin-antitoxin stability system